MDTEKTRVSIALAVYNGERYFRDQLDSFVSQTRRPDELVISDNASTDSTREVVRDFASRAPFDVRLVVNERNLGVTRNFERAISECSGDIIFLSDCDDVWYPHKIAAMEAALLNERKAGLVLSNADRVDERLQPLGYQVWQSVRFKPSARVRKKMAEGRLLKRSIPSGGSCMAFRAALKPLILPLPGGEDFMRTGYDCFIAWTVLFSGAGGIALIPEPLMAYRFHAAQLTHAALGTSLFPHLKQIFAGRKLSPWGPVQAAVAERIERVPSSAPYVNENVRSALLRHWKTRGNLPPRGITRVPVVARELLTLRYHRFSTGFSTALKDLLFVE